MVEFEQLWNDIVKRSDQQNIPIVQDKAELEYVFNILRGCNSYLEVGTAEGNSLYVLAQAMPKGSSVTYIDWAEPHTEKPRQWALDRLADYSVKEIHADSNNLSTPLELEAGYFDAVLIDAGHDDLNVVIDAMLYGPHASKYIIFHDIRLPDVERVFDWYSRQRRGRSYRVVNSETFGYGIIEL